MTMWLDEVVEQRRLDVASTGGRPDREGAAGAGGGRRPRRGAVVAPGEARLARGRRRGADGGARASGSRRRRPADDEVLGRLTDCRQHGGRRRLPAALQQTWNWVIGSPGQLGQAAQRPPQRQSGQTANS